MDSVHADVLAARSHLGAQGWIPRGSESFRHLPPPAAALWLGDGQPLECAAADDGWTLVTLPGTPAETIEARWLDAADARDRSALFAGLPVPGDDEAAPFAWAHRALVRRGLRVRIAPSPPGGTTWLVLRRRACAAVEAPLLVIELLPDARCVLLEAHESEDARPVVQNLQVHVRLGERATLQHRRLAMPAAGASVAHHLHAQLAQDARYEQCLLATGSDYHLQRNVFDLQGPRATASSGGVLLATGAALEQQVLARHAAPHTRSVAEVLALASGTARVVANAHTRIAPGCDEAETRQRLWGIPTSGQPRLVLRPHLEIHHDQVQAAHGATWGCLPEEALFHARQRGLDEAAAKALILEGLAQALLARVIDDPGVPEDLRLDAALAAAVARHLAHAPVQQESIHG
jgi:Fe-S cluster assembly protein SufD